MPKCSIFRGGVAISPTGKVRPCCAYNYPEGDQVPGFWEDWRSKHQELAEQSETQWLPGCAECKLAEGTGNQSLRQIYNQRVHSDLEYWDIKLNNTCNLACRMCNGTSSSTWASIINKHKSAWDSYYTDISQTGWHRDLDNILPYVLFAKTLKFTGGEPMLIPQVKTIIDYVIEHDVASDIDLTLITNGTYDITRAEWWDRIQQFKSVEVMFSIDAKGDRFEYIRSGAQWHTVSQNVIKFVSKLNNKTWGRVTALPSALNINHLDELEQWCYSIGIEYQTSTPVIAPDFLSPQALQDTHLKQKLIAQMKIQDAIWNTDYKDFIDV